MINVKEVSAKCFTTTGCEPWLIQVYFYSADREAESKKPPSQEEMAVCNKLIK
jgi:hypothetical protein